ncbi:acylphosphatase [Methylomonas paludis]|uniref:acylphosphatase n=1 Tax=Methylomonas paludis TaxID=1173101 RepID=A0A975RA56_9GAMM|nr:acylphosphatase [Methylomonas paludis]QWF70983.1 acylphosphatase [Methylomonas paludis]
MTHSVEITVKGRVQGVYFRAYTRKQALKLNVRGYVENLENGDVKLIAKGQPKAVQELIAWCHNGPLLAKVNQVIVIECHVGEEFADFHIR